MRSNPSDKAAIFDSWRGKLNVVTAALVTLLFVLSHLAAVIPLAGSSDPCNTQSCLLQPHPGRRTGNRPGESGLRTRNMVETAFLGSI